MLFSRYWRWGSLLSLSTSLGWKQTGIILVAMRNDRGVADCPGERDLR